MDEIVEYFKKAERKLESSKILYDAGDYSNSLSLSYLPCYWYPNHY